MSSPKTEAQLFDVIKAALNHCDDRQFYVIPFELRERALAALAQLETPTVPATQPDVVHLVARFVDLVNTTKPDTSGSGAELQQRSGRDWIEAYKRSLLKAIDSQCLIPKADA